MQEASSSTIAAILLRENPGPPLELEVGDDHDRAPTQVRPEGGQLEVGGADRHTKRGTGR